MYFRNEDRFIKIVVMICFGVLLPIIITILLYINLKNLGDNKSQNTNVTNATIKSYDFVEIPNVMKLTMKNLFKKDWHDYIAMKIDNERIGVGEHGKPAYLSENTDKVEEIFNQYGYNGLVSDKISLFRSVPDLRYKECTTKKYLNTLRNVSVIMPFYNEHRSVVLRSIYSILNRSPPELIYEIILVDDFSDINIELDQYIDENLPKVKIVHLDERVGVMKARVAGAKAAKAEVLIFLDSHIEANHNWLPPLLEPIELNRRTVMCPIIDVVHKDDFEYFALDNGGRGSFDWNLNFKRLELLPSDLEDRIKPFRNPIMTGGLFAISAQFFWEIGGYDEGLELWGGEQYEISFKIWMCGGEILDAPCSRVGHVFRGHSKSRYAKTFSVFKNYKRIAEVWMDEYAKYLYERKPEVYDSIDPGDLTKQKAIRVRLDCKSFKWFMEKIAFDTIVHFPLVEPPDYVHGAIQSLVNPKLCLDTLGKENIGLFWCSLDLENIQDNQNWVLNWRKLLKVLQGQQFFCLTNKNDTKVTLSDCNDQDSNQLWYYDHINKWLINEAADRCLATDKNFNIVFLNECITSDIYTKWTIPFVNKTDLVKIAENTLTEPQNEL